MRGTVMVWVGVLILGACKPNEARAKPPEPSPDPAPPMTGRDAPDDDLGDGDTDMLGTGVTLEMFEVPPPRARPIAPPPLDPASVTTPAVDDLVRAMQDGDIPQLERWMSRRLRRRADLGALAQASHELLGTVGIASRVLETRWQLEGRTRWTSALVEYRRPHAADEDPTRVLLYQFAIGRRGKLSRLLIREHTPIAQRRPPADDYRPVTRLHVPGRGDWAVIHGGPTRATNYHHRNRVQRHAYDLVIKREGRHRPKGSKKTNEHYYCHGQDMLAPAAGIVVFARDGVPENEVGTKGRGGGNGMIIDHGFGEYTSIWHAIPGSLRVRAGERVEAGQVIAAVGNSGSSTLPHIHMHLQTEPPRVSNERLRPFGLPAPFVDVVIDGQGHERQTPVRGEQARNASRDEQRHIAHTLVFVDL